MNLDDWVQLAGPALVLAAARDRIERGRAGRSALKVDLDERQRLDVSWLLGLTWHASGQPVTLPALRRSLSQLRVELEDLLVQVGGPLVDRVAQREAVRTAKLDEAAAARAALASVIDPDGLSPGLIDAVVAACLPAKNPLDRAEQLARVAAELPCDDYLPVLAARCFEDSHALDRSRALGAAAARMCLLLAGEQAPSGSLPAERWRSAWASAGVSCDRVSTTVLTLNLPLTGSPAVRAVTGVRGEPVWLTARVLDCAEPPDPPLPVVHVCENPSIVETAADRLGASCRPLICTFGRPSQAALTLVRMLAGAGTRLLVRADNDLAGRSFVAALQRVAPTAAPWHYDTNSPPYEEQVLDNLLADLASPG